MIVRWLFIVCVLLLAACTSSKTAVNDDDGCIGRCGMVGGVACGDCEYGYTCNTAQFCVEITNDDIPIDETDHTTDIDMVECPSMKSYENVKAAGFPFKDGNGKITFCRSGCDTPTENDPQCVRNLWEWVNWGRYLESQDGTFQYKECYPWPCKMPDMSAIPIDYSVCDKDLDAGGYCANMGIGYDLRVEKGIIGIHMAGASTEKYASHRAIFYDIAADTFETVAYAYQASYSYDRFIFDSGSDHWSKEIGNTYILSAKRVAAGWKYEAIYADDDYHAWTSRAPLIGEKWVILNVKHRTTGTYEAVYSKVDEWNWHPLKYAKVYEGNMVDNQFTFINDNHEIYVCDLDKLPYDPAKECIRIDRTGENPSRPRLNEENKNQLVYFAGVGEYGMTLVDISGTTPAYSLLSITPSDPQTITMGPEQFKGNAILYIESFMPPNEETRKDYKACFYRIDTKKQYCPVRPTKNEDVRYDMGFNSFDGNYQLWKTPASITARFRDIACYCEKEGVCPFEP